MKLRNSQLEIRPRPPATEVVVREAASRDIFDFDPKQDLTERDFSSWVSRLAASEERADKSDYYWYATLLNTFFPDRKGEYNLSEQLRLQLLSEIQELVENCRGSSTRELESFADKVRKYILAYPDHREDILIDNETWGVLLRPLQSIYRYNKRWGLNIALNLSIAFPNERDRFTPTEKLWESSKKALAFDREPDFWSGFFHKAAALKMLFPDRDDQLGLDEEAWEEARLLLASPIMRDSCLLDIAICCADNAEITNQGIHIHKESSLRTTPPLPARKTA